MRVTSICNPSCKKGALWEYCEKYDPGQPAQAAQPDQGRNCSLLADFQCIK